MDPNDGNSEPEGSDLPELGSATIGLPAIGKFVEQHVLAIAEYCEAHPDEFERLCDHSYSKTMFDLNVPFFRRPQDVEVRYEGRYRRTPQVMVCGEPVRFTNDWYARHYVRFIDYLAATHIIDEGTAAAYLESIPDAASRSTGEAVQGRLSTYAIGNAQNALVRNILGRIRPDSDAYGGWESTLAHFGGACAYCRAPLTTHDKDHVFGINYSSLGEHKRGNLVPACTDCNSQKADRDFREFLDATVSDPAETEERKARIIRFMLDRDYLPLALDSRVDQTAVSALLDEARIQVAKLAAAYVGRIQDLVDA